MSQIKDFFSWDYVPLAFVVASIITYTLRLMNREVYVTIAITIFVAYWVIKLFFLKDNKDSIDTPLKQLQFIPN